jgi:hypothetical protein
MKCKNKTIFENGRRPQFFFEKGRQPQFFFEKGRRPQFLKNVRRPQKK